MIVEYSWLHNLFKQTYKKKTPTKTWKPCNPVNIKKTLEYTLSFIYMIFQNIH